MITTLEIGTIVIPTESLLDFDQDYAELAAETLRRTAGGDANLRRAWSGKLRTEITGKGWVPSAFDSIDSGAEHTLKCAMPRNVSGATTSITLPANRRADTDHEPVGFALVGDRLLETPITNIAAILAASTDVATLTAVGSASGYRVQYFPQFTALITAAHCRGRSSAEYEWSIEAEQV